MNKMKLLIKIKILKAKLLLLTKRFKQLTLMVKMMKEEKEEEKFD